MSQLSSSASLGLRVLVGSLLTLSNLLLLIAISTNYWVRFYLNGDLYHVGIWKTCTSQICVFHAGAIQVKVIMIFLVILNLLANACVIIFLYTGEKDIKKMVGKTCIFNGCLGAVGMVFASIFFIESVSTLLYGFYCGWLSVILIIACGVISLVHSCLEPDQDTNSLQSLLRGNTNPPPYTTQGAPASVIVS